MADIRRWLIDLHLSEYAERFEAEKVDLDAAIALTEEDLKEMGVPMGPRKKLLRAIETLRTRSRTRSSGVTPSSSNETSTARPVEAERRQLTVVFCDLVGSTALSERLDAEDFRTLLRKYQQVCGAVIERYEGHVAQCLGDGLMVYFGWPRAHEDDAERALRAGLKIIEAIKELRSSADLSVRIGITTGPVVVGGTGSEPPGANTAVGETPNLAARVQGKASPNTVVITEKTRRLVGRAFDLLPLGEFPLKGISAAVALYQVVGPSSTESRFEATAGENLTQLIGREAELALLKERWQRAKDGEGQVVLLCGEPGIGKSRLLRSLRECVGFEQHTLHSYQSSPYHSNTGFHPLATNLSRLAGFERGDSADDKLDKIEALLVHGWRVPGLNLGETMPLLAAALSIPIGKRYAQLGLSPQQQKERTIAVFAEGVVRQSRLKPFLFLGEDIHWVDPSTLDLLARIVERIQSERLLMVLTHRPEFRPRWTAHAHVTLYTLNRLSRKHGASIIDQVTGGKNLPDQIRDEIVNKTDGVPLFVEELTKTVLESGILRESSGEYVLNEPLPPLAIPSTLHDSLMARLDRLSPVKDVAQIAACIGREFSYPLLAAVTALNDRELQDALQQLTDSGLVLTRGRAPDANYMFKHALVQAAAYESLLKAKRRKLHAQIADVLEQKFPEMTETEPEIVAYHYTEAGLGELAIKYWLHAGQQALAKSANLEAASHLHKGLDLISGLPESVEKSETELSVLNELAASLSVLEGQNASRLSELIKRANALCKKLGKCTGGGQLGARPT